MSKAFDMNLFLSGVLTGSKATQQRHARQALIMQAAILKRWKIDNPWAWQLKHVMWFFRHHLANHKEATQYYYLLTTKLIWKRRGKTISYSALITRTNESLDRKLPALRI